jgi:hypothetical protein
MAIPALLIYFVRRKRGLPFPAMFWMFGLFIVSCGLTHLMEVVLFAVPLYRLAGLVKLLTAAASWATVIGLVPLIPRALALRTPQELEREIAQRERAEAEREALIGQLREALASVKTLRGLLPLCAWCGQVRNDEGYWKDLQGYLAEHLDVSFTHGMCPACYGRHVPPGEAPTPPAP